MGVRFTPDQQQVIDARDCNLLVAAAAGSGKTAVLVERIIKMLTQDQPPVSVDELLVVTFTDAAAGEMKERVRNAIEKALEQDPENEHLQRQTSLIHSAQIMTTHSFCLSVIKEYFHVIDLDPGYRTGEDGEMRLLQHDVLDALLERYYEEGKPEFLDFVESYADGRDDKTIEERILQLYRYSQSYAQPAKWLQECVQNYTFSGEETLEELTFVRELLAYAKRYLEDLQQLARQLLELCREPGGPYMYQEAVLDDCAILGELLSCETYAAMQGKLRQLSFSKLARCTDKEIDEDLKEKVKKGRDEIKKEIGKLMQTYFAQSPEALEWYMGMAAPHMAMLAELTEAFMEDFARKKRSKNLIDFHDMEHLALQILTEEQDGILKPSAVAKVYQDRYREIMIDEYQDSNFVQETLLRSVSKCDRGNPNIFMVGDVKQSIYRFRLARPELFMEKYNTYGQQGAKERRIDLHQNFRSRREVLDSTNYFFRQCMTEEFGGIEYDEKAALYVGASYPEYEGNETEILVLEKSQFQSEDTLEAEALAVADRIQDLVEHHQVVDKGTGQLRPVTYNDIVILIRSLKGNGEKIAAILNGKGIPTYVSSKTGYFQTTEIQLLMDFLRVLDNPQQDIPLAAVLTGPMVGLTSKELAILKCQSEGRDFYTRLKEYWEQGEDGILREKVEAFFVLLHRYRRKTAYLSIYDLLCEILEKTGYGDYIEAMPGGEQRKANLQMLLEKAKDFEKTSYKGLFHFVRYMEQLQKYEVDYGEANIQDGQQQVVRLMTIHKSKGLEFPVVFVMHMGHQFSSREMKDNVVIHPTLGVGLDAIDAEKRSKSETALKAVICKRLQMDAVAEEMRILYVAMTRAKEKLILVGCQNQFIRCLEKWGETYQKRKDPTLTYRGISEAKSYFDWILPAAYRNHAMADFLNGQEMEAPFTNACYQEEAYLKVRYVQAEDLGVLELGQELKKNYLQQELEDFDTTLVYEEDTRKRMEEQFSYQYPYAASVKLYQTMSVSELKKRAYEEMQEAEMFPEEEVVPYLPQFLKEKGELTGAMRGSAYHRVMELLDFTKEYDVASLQQEIGRQIQEGLLEEEMGKTVWPGDLLDFWKQSLRQRMTKAARAGTLHREQPFVLGVDSSTIEADSSKEDLVLVEGIIDVWWEEDDGLVVMDYKTDRVQKPQALLDRYQAQLRYYAEALERLTGKKVKEAWIYSFCLKEEILVP